MDEPDQASPSFTHEEQSSATKRVQFGGQSDNEDPEADGEVVWSSEVRGGDDAAKESIATLEEEKRDRSDGILGRRSVPNDDSDLDDHIDEIEQSAEKRQRIEHEEFKKPDDVIRVAGSGQAIGLNDYEASVK